MADNILDLNLVKIERATVVMPDGLSYAIKSSEEFTVSEIAKLTKASNDPEQINTILDAIVIGLPVEVRDTLTIGQVTKLIDFFTSRSGQPGTQATGSRSSRASRKATAAT